MKTINVKMLTLGKFTTALLLVICALSTTNAQAIDANKMKLVVPAYSFPNDDCAIANNCEISAFWGQLVDAAEILGDRLVVIANDENGPGLTCNNENSFVPVPLESKCDCYKGPEGQLTDKYKSCTWHIERYEKAITELKKKNATVIGYTPLGYGKVQSSTQVILPILSWYYWHEMDGMFYDEADYVDAKGNEDPTINQLIRGLYWRPDIVANGATGVQYDPRVKSKGGPQLTIMNFGRIRNDLADSWVAQPFSWESWWNPHNAVFCPYENNNTSFNGAKTSIKDLSNKDRSLILVHGCNSTSWNAQFNFLRLNGFGYFYLTDDIRVTETKIVDGKTVVIEKESPWDKLPSYFMAMVNEIK